MSNPIAIMHSQGKFLYIGPMGANIRLNAAVNKKMMAKKYNIPLKGTDLLHLKK